MVGWRGGFKMWGEGVEGMAGREGLK